MSAYVLLNLLNELGIYLKYEACRAFYLFFRNEFNKFNNTKARMSDDTKNTLKSHFCRKMLQFCQYLCNGVMDVITFPENL